MATVVALMDVASGSRPGTVGIAGITEWRGGVSGSVMLQFSVISTMCQAPPPEKMRMARAKGIREITACGFGRSRPSRTCVSVAGLVASIPHDAHAAANGVTHGATLRERRSACLIR